MFFGFCLADSLYGLSSANGADKSPSSPRSLASASSTLVTLGLPAAPFLAAASGATSVPFSGVARISLNASVTSNNKLPS